MSYANSLLQADDPNILFTRAEDFFNRGLHREAWAACLSGCLGVFAMHDSVSFPVDATEYDCLNLVCQTLPDEEANFRALVQSWVLFAYGDRLPMEGDFEQALHYGRSLLEARGLANES